MTRVFDREPNRVSASEFDTLFFGCEESRSTLSVDVGQSSQEETTTMRERLARVLEEGRIGEAAERVLRASFWSPRVAPIATEVVDLAAWRLRESRREG